MLSRRRRPFAGCSIWLLLAVVIPALIVRRVARSCCAMASCDVSRRVLALTWTICPRLVRCLRCLRMWLWVTMSWRVPGRELGLLRLGLGLGKVVWVVPRGRMRARLRWRGMR